MKQSPRAFWETILFIIAVFVFGWWLAGQIGGALHRGSRPFVDVQQRLDQTIHDAMP